MSTQVVSADDGEALLFGRFRVLAELGTGGFGRVLHCFDRETRSEVASGFGVWAAPATRATVSRIVRTRAW